MKRYIFDGQSLGVGAQDPAAPANSGAHFYANYGPLFMAQAHPDLPYTIANVGGTHYTAGVEPSRGGSVHARVDQVLAQSPNNVLIDDGGANELGVTTHPAQSAEAVLAIKRQYCADRRQAGARWIIGMTSTPGIDQPDTEFWFSAAELVQLERMNEMLRADPASGGYDQVVDMAGIPELQDPANTDYFYDGVHFKKAAAQKVADLLEAEGV